MVDWRVTATTIYGDAVDDDVTVLVYEDWSTRCTGWTYGDSPGKETTKALMRKARRLGRDLRCEGPLDHRVTDYRDRLASQEKCTPGQRK